LLIRTLLLQAVMLSFIRYGGAIGVTRLAANSLLMQLFTLFSYFMDGLAYAAEALVGEAIGGRKFGHLRLIIRITLQVGFVVALITSILYALFPRPLLELLTDKQEVLKLALSDSFLMAAVPIFSYLAFLWDGILVGATDSKSMSIGVAGGAMSYLIVAESIATIGSGTMLWFAFLNYLLVRSFIEYYLGMRRIRALSQEVHDTRHSSYTYRLK
ncbi:MAG: MATE family efflux transporter, partial [Porphyromonadaceae bacterium]|nr:MATE family efflux transporter [Porphyromonadaceae bacterium]